MYVVTTEQVDADVPGVEFVSVARLAEQDERVSTLLTKYRNGSDELRWSLKPVVLSYLARTRPDQSILYCDNDTCFFSDPNPLFAYLQASGIVLTPHWRPLHPSPSRRHFQLNFLDGLFNAGCVGANARGIPAMDWWAAACADACEKDHVHGLYDDQRYLDLLPIYFPETAICRHYGFNLAEWNIHLRERDSQGRRKVPDEYPVALIHFTENTIKRIDAGRDPVLEPYLVRYREFQILARQALD